MFRGQIVVILVIGIIMAQFSLIEAAAQGQEAASGTDLPGSEISGNQDGQPGPAFKLPGDALGGDGSAGRLETAFKKVFPPGNLGQICHIPYIIRIVEQEQVEAKSITVCQVGIVYRDQFSACHGVGTCIEPQHLLDGFLFDVVQPAQVFVRLDHLHQVDAFFK